ncbi:MAG: ABC-three component system middle component 6 [Candidatus Pacearchaeota archaeon]|jgi:hypothetical protein
MILPSKHVKIAESLFGLGGIILSLLDKPKDLDKLWAEFERFNNTDYFPAYHNYDNFILAIDLLFLLNLIKLNEIGEIIKCN